MTASAYPWRSIKTVTDLQGQLRPSAELMLYEGYAPGIKDTHFSSDSRASVEDSCCPRVGGIVTSSDLCGDSRDPEAALDPKPGQTLGSPRIQTLKAIYPSEVLPLR